MNWKALDNLIDEFERMLDFKFGNGFAGIVTTIVPTSVTWRDIWAKAADIQKVKRNLGIQYYGRYVDDFVLVHQNKAYLQSCISRIITYLKDTNALDLHPNKIYLQHYSKGVQYLGAVIKPHRVYIANRTKGNFYSAIEKQNKVARSHKPDKEEQRAFLSSMNSYLGIMKHYKTYKLRKEVTLKNLSGWWWNYVYLSGGVTKFVLKITHVR